MFPRETPGRAAKAAARSLETWGAGWRASSGRGSREAPFQASLLSGVDLGESGRSKSRGKAATSWARHWPRSPPLCPSSAPPLPGPQGPARAAKPERTPGSSPSKTPPRREGHARCARDSPARWIAGQLRGGAGRRRARPADSNFVALGTAQSSLPRRASGRRGPGCDPAASAAARRALQPPAPPAPRFPAAPSQTLRAPRCSRWGSLAPAARCARWK